MMHQNLSKIIFGFSILAIAPLSNVTANAETQSSPSVYYQLSPAQKAKLTQLPIPLVVPTYLPDGFRLISAEGEKGQYANGDDDSGYSLVYQGKNNTCIRISSSKDGPRGQSNQIVKTKFGSIKVFTQTLNNNPFIYSFIPVKGNPSLTSGGSLPNPDASGKYPSCKAVSMPEYLRVLRSLAILK